MIVIPIRLVTPEQRQVIAARQADQARFYRDRGSVSSAILYQECSSHSYEVARHLAGIKE